MASSSKKKTTMAKINRENKVREKRMIKAARKEARKQAPSRSPHPHGARRRHRGSVDTEAETGAETDTRARGAVAER